MKLKCEIVSFQIVQTLSLWQVVFFCSVEPFSMFTINFQESEHVYSTDLCFLLSFIYYLSKLLNERDLWKPELYSVYLVTREHGAGVQCLKRNNWWEEGEIGLIKYSTLETQSATILQVCKVLTSLADDESPSRWKWNTREREILEQQSGVWCGVGTSGPISN